MAATAAPRQSSAGALAQPAGRTPVPRDCLGGDSDAGTPPTAAVPDGVPEHEVQELLKLKMRCGLPYVLVRWTGLDAEGDTWEPLDKLTNCEDAIAAFEQANGRSLPRPRRHRRPAPPSRPHRSRRPASRSRRHRPATWALRWWAGLCSTGGPTDSDDGVGAARHG